MTQAARPQPAASPATARLTRGELVRLGQANRPWDFLPLALQALGLAPDDAGLRALAAANFAKLELRTPALELLDGLDAAAAADPGVRQLRAAIERLPDDRVPADRIAATCRANVERLRRRSIDLTADLERWESALSSITWHRATGGNLVRRRGGVWTGLADHAGAAAAFAREHLTSLPAKAAALTIEGVDPPWILLHAAAATPRAADGFWPRLSVVQADAAEFLDGLAHADLPVLEEDRTRVFVGPGAGARFAAELHERLELSVAQPYIPLRSLRASAVPAVGASIDRAGAAQAREHERLRREVEAMYAPRDAAWWRERYARRNDSSPLRALIVTSRFSTYVRHASADLADALARAGWDARVLIEPDDASKLTTLAHWRALREHAPDLMVVINYPRAALGERLPPQLPSVCWIQDAMPHLIDPATWAATGPLDFVVGHLHEEALAAPGFPHDRSLVTPVVASDAKFHPTPVPHAPELACEIGFISHHGETPGAMHARLLDEARGQGRVPQVLEALRPEVERIALDPMSPSPFERLRRAVDDAVHAVMPGAASELTVRQLLRQYALPLADRLLRHQTLAWAAEIAERRDWRLHIRGRGWDRHPTLSRFARPTAEHGEELRACHQLAAVQLHASMHAMVHQRVLECAFSGGLPLCRRVRDALDLHPTRVHAVLRRDLPEWAAIRHSGYLGFAVADHPEAMALTSLWQRLGLDAPDRLWIPQDAPPPSARARYMLRECDPCWVLGDIEQTTFATPRELEERVERAIERPAWRAAHGGLIARRARQELGTNALVRKMVHMIEHSLQSQPADPSRGTTTPSTPTGAPYDPARIALDPAWMQATMRQHRRVRDRLGLATDEPSLRRLIGAYRPPAWVSGFISLDDAAFLYDIARCVHPDRIIEIGTASGVSTAVLLLALADMGRGLRDGDEPRLHSYDIATHCYFDRSRHVGDAVGEMTPELAGGLRLRTRAGARTAAADFAGRPVSFVFLDANHSHPFPIADALALAPILVPGAWIVIHDVALPRLAREHERRTGVRVPWHQAGVEKLLAHWPGETIVGEGSAHNIAALRMPEGGLTLEHFRAVLDEPWEEDVDDIYAQMLGGRRPVRGARAAEAAA